MYPLVNWTQPDISNFYWIVRVWNSLPPFDIHNSYNMLKNFFWTFYWNSFISNYNPDAMYIYTWYWVYVLVLNVSLFLLQNLEIRSLPDFEPYGLAALVMGRDLTGMVHYTLDQWSASWCGMPPAATLLQHLTFMQRWQIAGAVAAQCRVEQNLQVQSSGLHLSLCTRGYRDYVAHSGHKAREFFQELGRSNEEGNSRRKGPWIFDAENCCCSATWECRICPGDHETNRTAYPLISDVVICVSFSFSTYLCFLLF